MVRLCEQTLAARLWTVRRRLSNVARGAAEGLEGPAGTERLDPTRSCRWVLRKAVVQRLNSADQPAKLAQVRCNEGLSCITAEGLAYLADTSRSSPIRERRESVSLDFVWHAWLVRIGALAPLRALKRGLRAPF
jgi:hypothetical protein